MQIITDIDDKIKFEKSAVTIGTFDGLHVGHLEILDSLKLKAREFGLTSVVITFYPHPRTVVTKDFNLRLLTPVEEKKKLFDEIGIDYLYIISFTEEFSKKSYKEFFDEVLKKIVKAKHLVIGYDHKFGKNRDGDLNKLIDYNKENGIGMTVVGPKEIDNQIVSSTKVRNALISGDLETANKMLGRFYFLDGIVVEGTKRGRTLGFPTANLGLEDNNKLVPCNGVYFVKVLVENVSYYGVANIGLRPTFNHTNEPITEVYILDFNKDIYGKKISVEFIKRIRDEKKFSSKDELEKNIKRDVETAKKYLIEFNK